MKKAALFYFSGTGGTAIAARFLKQHFEEEGWECLLYEMRLPLSPLPSIKDCDLIGFGYPIHAFNTPLTFLKFVKKNIPCGRLPYFIFKVSGEPFHLNDASSSALYRLLKHKGYRFVMEKHFLMPYNIMFRYPDAMAKQMILYLDALTRYLVRRLLALEVDQPHYPFSKRLLSWLLRIEWIAPAVNAWTVVVKKDKCLHCGLCLRDCPNQALYFNKKGQIRINNRCSLCMRCVMNCPTDAFRFGFLNHWKVSGVYPYQKLLADPRIPSRYHLRDEKDYFRHFQSYFDQQDALLKKAGLPLPPLDVSKSD